MIIGFSLFFIILLFLPYIWSHFVSRYYQKEQIKRSLTGELRDLSAPLKSMGFDTANVKAFCEGSDNSSRYCEATISSYVVVRSSPSELSTNADQLSNLLNKNGWHQREDYPTKDWFNKIGEQIDYQPDQFNSKKIGNVDCILDFFTSFSSPQPAAVTLNASCSKGTSTLVPLD